MTSGENPAYPHFPEENCYHFAGTNGSLDFPSMYMHRYAPVSEPSWWNQFETGRLPIERANPLERQLEHFVEVVRGHAAPRVSVRGISQHAGRPRNHAVHLLGKGYNYGRRSASGRAFKGGLPHKAASQYKESEEIERDVRVLLLDTAFAAAPIYNFLVESGHEVWVMGNRPDDLLARKARANWIDQDYSKSALVEDHMICLGIDRGGP